MTSDKTSRRLARILSMLPYIIENEGADLEDLVARFDYRDKAELVKDLHLVFVTGLPGYGPGDLIDVDIFDDEVSIDAADYFSRPLRLTSAEALGLLAAGTTLLASDQAPPHLDSAVAKLVDVVGTDTAGAVRFDVPTPEMVGTLRSAIEDRTVVRIGYVGMASNERTVRDVEGWAVSFSGGNWYLTGHCRRAGARRTFRVDRIDDLTVLDERYEPPAAVDIDPVAYRAGTDDAHVSFSVTANARWVAEYYPVDAAELDDGALRIDMSVGDPLLAARLLIQLGPDAYDVMGEEVLAVRNRVLEFLMTTYARTG